MSGYQIVHLDDMLKELGEDKTIAILSSFSCPLNKDVEYFLKYRAIAFSKQGLAKTQLVFTSFRGESCLIGYYTICIKYITVPFNKRTFTNTLKKRLNKFALYNKELKAYIMTAPLIAQLGKNFNNEYNKLITGDELLKMACDSISYIQEIGGGKFVYLECEDKRPLIDFYSNNGFMNFGKRTLDRDEKDSLSGDYLIQMLKYNR